MAMRPTGVLKKYGPVGLGSTHWVEEASEKMWTTRETSYDADNYTNWVDLPPVQFSLINESI